MISRSIDRIRDKRSIQIYPKYLTTPLKYPPQKKQKQKQNTQTKTRDKQQQQQQNKNKNNTKRNKTKQKQTNLITQKVVLPGT